MIFTPQSFEVFASIRYFIDSDKINEHHQKVSLSLNVQAGLGAILFGAIIGSLFGLFATQISNMLAGQWGKIAIIAVPAIVVSAAAVVAFARKEGAQPLVTIQDFWGGAFLGFLVAYSGVQVLGTLFSSGGAGAAATATPFPTTPMPTP